MLVKHTIYLLNLLIFAVSIFILIYSIKNKNKDTSIYIEVLSIVFTLYSIADIFVLPFVLHLDIGLELLLFHGISVVSNVLFIISLILTDIKRKKLSATGISTKHKAVFALIIAFPILMFCFSYFREMIYINNSKLILACSVGDGFNEEDYAYAISEDYSKKISIGADFRGYAMEKHLPSSFNELRYTRLTDEIEINDDNITIFRDNNIVYKLDTSSRISKCNVEEVFYKK